MAMVASTTRLAAKAMNRSRQPIKTLLLTLSAHAREGYSSHFVCHSLCFSILEKSPFSGLKLTSVYILGDDLTVRGQRPVIKSFST